MEQVRVRLSKINNPTTCWHRNGSGPQESLEVRICIDLKPLNEIDMTDRTLHSDLEKISTISSMRLSQSVSDLWRFYGVSEQIWQVSH